MRLKNKTSFAATTDLLRNIARCRRDERRTTMIFLLLAGRRRRRGWVEKKKKKSNGAAVGGYVFRLGEILIVCEPRKTLFRCQHDDDGRRDRVFRRRDEKQQHTAKLGGPFTSTGPFLCHPSPRV